MSDIGPELESAIATLRNLGWIVYPPAKGVPPEPRPGQVWRSPKPRVEDRTVISVGPHRSYPWAGDKCVRYSSPSHPPHPEWGPVTLNPEAWAKWVKQSGARPVED